jgi:hypothetical protein
MDKDLRDLLRAWLSDEDDNRLADLLIRLAIEPDFRDAFAAELVLLGQIKALQADSLGSSPQKYVRHLATCIL